ncbi:serpin family protein [Proteiniclasticum sp. SCR006]|uniref:Serpin family protein n=1 Tax=Proteiniclasticum aestuarii TaxID=2817862 RepID=A0A939KGH3_9CLOT|nr:serpin family protein [Proteiniclasticum aestuarii]MBO1264434.1 serpin family protein [Proteiniclasticum aestuarii]
MKKKRLIPILTTLLLGIMVFTFTGCSQKASAAGDDLMKDIRPGSAETIDAYIEEDNIAAMDFSLELFKMNLLCQNTLISPVSALSALGMTANGARENTLAEMEAVFGLPREKINQLMNLYMRNLPDEDKLKVSMANSIWFREGGRIEVNKEFLQTNANYYEAGVYRSPFDESTLKAINDWVEKETDGMIVDILDQIPAEAVMYLINALSFDAEWQTIYNESSIREDIFTADDGTIQRADMMYSEEHLYIEDDGAKGFIKDYAGGQYAFVAMLPPEDLHLSAYIAGLTGEKLQSLIKNAENVEVKTMMPKFTTEYSVEMSDILKSMGMVDAFDEQKADLKDLGTAEGNLYISRVIHKTKIEVDEKGTKAGAATVVEVSEESAAIEEPKSVYLDRPFLYLIVDKESYLPLFIGTTLFVE